MKEAAHPDNPASITEHIVFISLGSNIHPETYLPKAVRKLEQHGLVEAVSSVWETPPANLYGPNFLNAMVQIRTTLGAEELKHQVLRPIEAHLGRVRTGDKNAPRTIDLDIILYDDQLLDERLKSFAYLAVPLSELYPQYIPPGEFQTVAEAARRTASETPIRLRSDIKLHVSTG